MIESRAYIQDLTSLWIHRAGIKAGICPASAMDLFAAFAEWLDDHHPGLRQKLLWAWPVTQWGEMMSKSFPQLRQRRHKTQKVTFYTNYLVRPKRLVRQAVVGCGECGRPHQVLVEAPTETADDLKAQLAKLNEKKGFARLPSIDELKEQVEAAGLLEDVDLGKVFSSRRLAKRMKRWKKQPSSA